MCGPEITNRPRGGALAALNSSSQCTNARISGDLAFHTPGSPASVCATHARLTPDEACDLERLSDLHVVIHSSGDLTRSADACGLFRRFALPASAIALTSHGRFLELSLDEPLSLEVGKDGIIGRRVSLFSGSSLGRDKVIAEGIVGFNFLQKPVL